MKIDNLLFAVSLLVLAREPQQAEGNQGNSSFVSKSHKQSLQVFSLERVHLNQPMALRVEGSWRQVDDVLLVYVRPASVTRFLPKGAPSPEIHIGDRLAFPLYPPNYPIWALVAPMPSGDLRDADLWVSEFEKIDDKNIENNLMETVLKVKRQRPYDVISPAKVLTSAVVEDAGSGVIVEDHESLLKYALRQADALAARQ